jgi:hypothetical protein
MFDIPEKIFEKYGTSKAARAKILMARDYDLDNVTVGLNDSLIRAGRVYSVEQAYPIVARFGRCDFEIAKQLEIEFKKFVAITLIEPNTPHAPSGAVDMYWHFFILHTAYYFEFSEAVWGGFRGDGKYRHHFPATDDTRAGMLRAYWNTLDRYLEIFGEPPSVERPGSLPVKIWTEHSTTSGDSYSGIVDNCEPLSAEDLANFTHLEALG